MDVIDIKETTLDKKIHLVKNEKRNFVWLLHRPKTAMCNFVFDLEEGAALRTLFLFVAARDANFHINILIYHRGRASLSKSIVRGVGYNQSRVEVNGNVQVQKKARFSNTYFEGRALLFHDAHARIDPKLEIHTDEIQKATHAATVSQIRKDELFYLESRGIEPQRAEALKVQGFLLAPFSHLDIGCPSEWGDIIKPLTDQIHHV